MAPVTFILALNCGSSSLKFGVYQKNDRAPALVCEGEAEEIGGSSSKFWLKQGEAKAEETLQIADHGAALDQALTSLDRRGFKDFWAVGHRVVHGGPKLLEHQLLAPTVLDELKAAIPFAPLHLPASLQVIERLKVARQVICLDTAFHKSMPDVARTFALPQAISNSGVHRYGFHGISLESI